MRKLLQSFTPNRGGKSRLKRLLLDFRRGLRVMDSDQIKQMILQVSNGDLDPLEVYMRFVRSLARGKITAPKVAATTLLELEEVLQDGWIRRIPEDAAGYKHSSVLGEEEIPGKSGDIRMGHSLDVRVESSRDQSGEPS
jgi:hypothetical protein